VEDIASAATHKRQEQTKAKQQSGHTAIYANASLVLGEKFDSVWEGCFAECLNLIQKAKTLPRIFSFAKSKRFVSLPHHESTASKYHIAFPRELPAGSGWHQAY
ncbi:MAG: hypothetical protein AAFO91_19015, partial [Bacteroidota bacterium]